MTGILGVKNLMSLWVKKKKRDEHMLIEMTRTDTVLNGRALLLLQ